MDENISNILGEYDRESDLYKYRAARCEALVKELLGVEGQRVHSVTSRLKRRDKLEEKLEREGKNYKRLSEVTDTAGVRIITHFEDEVDRIGTLIEKEFGTDPERSIDKRKILDPDRFGYLSLHYICGLHPNRLMLPENRRYTGLLCEIQIRSILQHAWAEIEHDLGYKPDNTVPAPIRRRFSRLAGLLEIADQEFRSIRDELENYAARVEDEIKAEPSQVGIDDVSLAAFIRHDELCRELDAVMAKDVGLDPISDSLNPQGLADQLRHTAWGP
jgi:ppGpp synthetase/RelA/SpoT-type nucleotidyltranferase